MLRKLHRQKCAANREICLEGRRGWYGEVGEVQKRILGACFVQFLGHNTKERGDSEEMVTKKSLIYSGHVEAWKAPSVTVCQKGRHVTYTVKRSCRLLWKCP